MWFFALQLMFAHAPLDRAATPALAHWEFAAALTSEVGGQPVSPEWAVSGKDSQGGGQVVRTGTGPLYTFEEATVGDAPTQVMHVAPGVVMRVPLSFVPAGTGFIGRWTLVMDVAIDPGRWSEAPLVQANPDDDEEAELIAGVVRGIGDGSGGGAKKVAQAPKKPVSKPASKPPKGHKPPGGKDPAKGPSPLVTALEAKPGSFAGGVWRRVAMVVDAEAQTVALFVDGARVRVIKGNLLDSRYGLESELVLFGDPKLLSPGVRIAALAVRTGVVGDDVIARLGGASAAGLTPAGLGLKSDLEAPTFSDVPAEWKRGTPAHIDWHVDYAAGDIAWFVRNADGSREEALGRVPMAAGHAVVRLPADFEGNAGLLVARWQAHDGPREASFRVTATGLPMASKAAALPNGSLVVNGDFAAGVEGWDVTGGARVESGVLVGGKGDFVGTQTIDLAARGVAPEMVARGLAFSATAKLKRTDRIGRFGDRGTFVVTWLDAAGHELARHRSLSGDDTDWVERTVVGLVPAGAVRGVVGVDADARKSDANSVRVDDVALQVSAVVPAGWARLAKPPVVYPDVDPTRATVTFEVDGPWVAPVVTWHADAGEEQTATLAWTPIGAAQSVVTATLSGLVPGKDVAYAIAIGAQDEPPAGRWTVHWPDPASDALKVAWWSDNQAGWKTFRKITAQIAQKGPDILMASGDIVHRGYLRRGWMTEWFGPLSVAGLAQTTPLWVARGNHDGEHPFAYAFAPLPGNGAWYAATRGRVRFIFLDTEANSVAVRTQLDWLKRELASRESREADFRVAVLHKAPFANRWDSVKSKYDGEPFVRADFVPAFEEGGVDLVVGGHAHAYQRLRRQQGDPQYVVIGGAGGYIDTARTGKWPVEKELLDHHWIWMDVEDGHLKWEARDLDGKVFDRFELRRRSRSAAKARP